MSPAGRGGRGASHDGWQAPVFLCGVTAWKGTRPGQELPPPCLLPEIKGFVSAVDVFLWLSPGNAAGAGLFAATCVSLSPVADGLTERRLSLRGCGERVVRWWHWDCWTRQAGPCTVQLEAVQWGAFEDDSGDVPWGLGSARRSWAALASHDGEGGTLPGTSPGSAHLPALGGRILR